MFIKKYYCDGSRKNVLHYRDGLFRLFVLRLERPHDFICTHEYIVVDNQVVLIQLLKDIKVKKCFILRGDVEPNSLKYVKSLEKTTNELLRNIFSAKQLEFERAKIDVVTGTITHIKTIVDAMGNVN